MFLLFPFLLVQPPSLPQLSFQSRPEIARHSVPFSPAACIRLVRYHNLYKSEPLACVVSWQCKCKGLEPKSQSLEWARVLHCDVGSGAYKEQKKKEKDQKEKEEIREHKTKLRSCDSFSIRQP